MSSLKDQRQIAGSRVEYDGHGRPDWMRAATWGEVIENLFKQSADIDIATVTLEMRPTVSGTVQLTAHARIGTLDGSCPRCHTLSGRPHTEYCSHEGIHHAQWLDTGTGPGAGIDR